jgi:hypothetical protein
MLRAGSLDGVLIAAPSTLHLDLVTQIAAAGLPVLCKKPCGVAADQAREAAVFADRIAISPRPTHAVSDGSATVTTRTVSLLDSARRCTRPIRPAPTSPRRKSVIVKR